MFILGITGGIGSGKSTATKFFKEKGAIIFDADSESKKILKSNTLIQQKLITFFGNKILSNKEMNFKKLAEIAFKNVQNQNWLNKIMWPEVNLLIKKCIKNAKIDGEHLFIVDAALLFESGNIDFFDDILLITAPESLRIKSLSLCNKISLKQIKQRISLQMPEIQKKKLANSIILNDGSIKKLHNELNKYYKKLN